MLNTAWAVQSARLGQAAAIEEQLVADNTSPDGYRTRELRHAVGAYQDEFIGSEIGPLFGWTSGHAVSRVSEATDAITRTPRLFKQVAAGKLEPAKLAAIHRALGRVIREVDDDGDPVTVDLAKQVETALLGESPDDDGVDRAEAAAVEQANVDQLARQSARQVRQRTDRILAQLDKVAASKAAQRRRRDRIGVFAHPDDEPGLTHLHAILSSDAAAKIMAAVDELARQLRADTTTSKTLPECRADALTDLILGNANITTKLVIQVPVHTGATETTGHARGSAFWVLPHRRQRWLRLLVAGCVRAPDHRAHRLPARRTDAHESRDRFAGRDDGWVLRRRRTCGRWATDGAEVGGAGGGGVQRAAEAPLPA